MNRVFRSNLPKHSPCPIRSLLGLGIVLGSLVMTSTMSPHPPLSQRILKTVSESNKVSTSVSNAWQNLYSREKPDGVVMLGVAENSLMSGWLVEYFNKNFELGPSDLHYQSVSGPNAFKRSICSLVNRYFNPVTPVKQEHLACGLGVTAVLEALLYGICDEGDHILVTQPYYDGFYKIFTQRLGLVPIGVDVQEPMDPTSVLDAYEMAYKANRHLSIKCVLLCNPHNPLGYSLPRQVIVKYIEFCEKYDLQLVVDEIYALSVYENGSDTNPFVSILSIDHQSEVIFNPSRVHLVYGMSKDFGSCGLRAGVLISQHNHHLINSLTPTLNRIQIPISSENLITNLLSNQSQLDWFISENKKKLSEAYRFATQQLDKIGIKYKPAGAGLFIMLDLSPYLSLIHHLHPYENTGSSDYQKEKVQDEACFLTVLDKFKVYLGPGMIAYHNPQPGYFRMTFSVPQEYLRIGLSRLSEFKKAFDAQFKNSNPSQGS